MKDIYIFECEPGWYVACMRDSHFCISCGKSLQSILDVITSYAIRFKTIERVYKELSKGSAKGIVPRSIFESREKVYLSEGSKYSSEVQEAWDKGLEYLRNNTANKKVGKLLSKAPVKRLVSSPPETKKEETIKEVTVTSTKVIRKPVIHKLV